MPIDQKRINAPDNSVPYQLYSRLILRSYQEKLEDVLNKEGKRKNGRKHHEARKICKFIFFIMHSFFINQII